MTVKHSVESTIDASAERRLLSRVVDQDKEALASLYRIYHPRLFRFAFKLTSSYGASEELVNDIMLAVWNGAGSFRNGSKLSTWIFGIAYRKCMSHLRRKSIKIDVDVSVEQIADGKSGSVENEQWVLHGLQMLPEEQRISLVLVFFVGCSYQEVADITGCKEATVKTRMFHARRKLRLSLPDIAQPRPQGVIR